jgi:hypothetical protein
MTTYVLGAGASFHAGYPLARDLGNCLYAWVKAKVPSDDFWRGCIEELHEAYGGLGDIESILTELDECPEGSPAEELGSRGNIRGAIRFLIPAMFKSVREKEAVLYERLVAEHVQAGDVFLTFNYDLALERELRNRSLWEINDGYGFSLGLEAPRSGVKILKLHGSANWWGPLFGGMTGFFQVGSSVFPERPALMDPSDFSFLQFSGMRDPASPRIGRGGAVPAIVMPTHRKQFFEATSFGHEWEPFWRELWGQAEEVLAASEKLVVIGYSMPQADEAARALLLDHLAKKAQISLWCGQSNKEIAEDFRERGFTVSPMRGAGRFEDFLGLETKGHSTG